MLEEFRFPLRKDLVLMIPLVFKPTPFDSDRWVRLIKVHICCI